VSENLLEYDFGRVPPGQQFIHSFAVHNSTEAEWRISEVVVSCTCTTTKLNFVARRMVVSGHDGGPQDMLSPQQVLHAQAEDDPKGGDSFLRIDLRTPLFAVGENDRSLAESGAGSA
jgi:hypothetical protein